VVNIITHDGRTQPGFKLQLGAGHGQGEQGALRSHLSYGGSFADDLVRLYLSGTWFTTRGPSLTIDHQKLYGALPEPAGDGVSIFLPGKATAHPVARDQVYTIYGVLDVGPVSLAWFSGIDYETRELGPGGSLMAVDYRSSPLPQVTHDRLVAGTNDHLHSLQLRYSDRFLKQRFGVNAQLNGVLWRLIQDPFGVFPRSEYLPYGATTILRANSITRVGFTVDLDYQLPFDNHLLFGAELLSDAIEDVTLTTFDPFNGPLAGPNSCFEELGFSYRPQVDSVRPCSVTETALNNTRRTIAALYATDELRLGRLLALNVGLRSQVSTTYDPTLLVSSGLVIGLASNIFLKVTYGEGFRPPDFQATANTSGIASGISFKANESLDVERSRAVEVEINARLFENKWPIKQWYVRADYSYSRMTGIITFPAGEYENSGDRDVHSVELLSKLAFYGDHELWTSYYFVDVVDSDTGRVRNIANHILNAGARVSFFDSHLQLSSVLTWRGSMEDLNRTPSLPWPGPPFSLTDTKFVQVAATGIEVTKIPSAVLLRFGVAGRRLFGRWDISAWVYNALDTQYSDPDFFFDDRIMSRPQPKPGLSFFVETGVQW
jgi:outer membrane receptor protein involved in Fe transport